MKNQYFGDVNDYQKYSLLRALIDERLSLGVCWMLTPDEGRPDGAKTRYLTQAPWRAHDPQVFDWLRATLASGIRNVRSAEACSLFAGTRFAGEIVPDSALTRGAWFHRALASLAGCDVLFFDPDNGLQVPSKPVGRPGSSKYLLWSEVEEAWRGGCSVLAFQHFAREERSSHSRRLARRLATHTAGAVIRLIRTANVLYLAAVQHGHRGRFDEALTDLAAAWRQRIAVEEFPQPAGGGGP